MNTDISVTKDRGESVAMMEPLLLSEGSRHREALIDLAVELAARSAGFRRNLPEGVLKDDYSADTEKRNLQLEAKAHIAVSQWIDEGGLRERAATYDGICEIHRQFCERLPDDLLWVDEADTGERMRVIPSEPRQCDVRVGQYIPISAGALPRFLEKFESIYSGLGKSETTLATRRSAGRRRGC